MSEDNQVRWLTTDIAEFMRPVRYTAGSSLTEEVGPAPRVLVKRESKPTDISNTLPNSNTIVRLHRQRSGASIDSDMQPDDETPLPVTTGEDNASLNGIPSFMLSKAKVNVRFSWRDRWNSALAGLKSRDYTLSIGPLPISG